MIRAIWKSGWDRTTMPGPFDPAASSTPDYVSFFIFWLVSLPAIWFPVHKIRHLFTVKAYFVPPAGIAFLIWAIVRAGSIGAIVRQPNTVHGSAWAGSSSAASCPPLPTLLPSSSTTQISRASPAGPAMPSGPK